MNMGKKLAAARKGMGLTQEKLAERLGVTFQAVSTWERNESLPDVKNLIALSKTLQVSLDDLLSDREAPSWEMSGPAFDPERMYTYLKARAQAAGLSQTLAALPFMREKHRGQVRKGMAALPYMVHPLTMACHAMAMGIMEDDVIAAALLHDVVEDTDTLPEDLPVGKRVRDTVRLLSYNMYPGLKKEILPLYYGNIMNDPLAALVKCLDRCSNLSSMADGFTKERMVTYILQTERDVMPLLEAVKAAPEYNSAAWILRYQMTALMETFKRLL